MREVVPASMQLSMREMTRLDKIEKAIAEMPDDEGELLDEMKESYGHLYAAASYGLA
jgi:hypothetical protein